MVIDSTDRERLAVTREELYRMLQHEDLSKASLLVYANKQVSFTLVNFVFNQIVDTEFAALYSLSQRYDSPVKQI